ncbi:MAG: extracellular solute-binding protein [Pseudobdellovibrionaceae bacterium]
MTSKIFNLFLVLFILAIQSACTRKTDSAEAKQNIWIYTSLYKDTIADIQPKLEKEFPNIKFNFYQAGSEEVASKVNGEQIAGQIQADIMISSDRFWYEDLARQGKLLSYKPVNTDKVDAFYKNSEGFYHTLSYPVMVMAYNSEAMTEKELPSSFKDLTDKKFKAKASSGSPLASGTNFTTVAFLQRAYGWEFFKGLRENDFLAEGGNSGVIRRLQSKERPIGIVLLENILRLKESDPLIKAFFPKDGVIMQSNVLAIEKKESNTNGNAQKVADWLFSQEGQSAMTRSFMYSGVPGYPAPVGAPEFATLMSQAKKWDSEFIEQTLKDREKIKEEFSKIMF